ARQPERVQRAEAARIHVSGHGRHCRSDTEVFAHLGYQLAQILPATIRIAEHWYRIFDLLLQSAIGTLQFPDNLVRRHWGEICMCYRMGPELYARCGQPANSRPRER